jgi:hypothetical protein
MFARLRRVPLFLWLCALVPGAVSAEPDSGGAGVSLSLGDAGYAGLSLFGDLGWNGRELDPYAWAEVLADDYIGQLTVGGGAWKDVSRDARVKAGAALSLGRLKEWDDSSSAVTVELGVEKDVDRSSFFGGELRLSRGRLPGPRAGAAAREELDKAGRGRPRLPGSGPAELDAFTTRELAAYYQRPWRDCFLRPRAALIRAEGGSILSLGAVLLVPRGDNTFSAGLTLESGDADALYLTLGAYRRFL